MWPFKKKEKKIVSSVQGKFNIGDEVRFRYNDELTFGKIWSVRKNRYDKIVYTIQVGGQCPWFAEDIQEGEIFYHKFK